jgi:BirA family biotin operon repressor/biotin-[acetyl-CoA-carboxylase] ligase
MSTVVDRPGKIVEDWTVWEYDSVTSTNLVAAELPAWSAVRAETQTAGRGRFQRKWVSDRGGLWLSAVVPTPSPNGRILPLLAGVAVCDVLYGLGVRHLRLRWPNDVMACSSINSGPAWRS